MSLSEDVPSWLRQWRGQGIIVRAQSLEVVRAVRATGLPDPAAEVDPDVPHLATHDTLVAGQILVEGVATREGMLVYPALTRVGQSHLERLKNFASLVGLQEPFLVLG